MSSRPCTPRVLVTGSEHPGGLAAIRALRLAGFEPWAADSAPGGYGARSRASAGTVRIPDPRTDPEAFAGELAQAADRVGAAVVLPGTESALLALGTYRHVFPDAVAVGAPPEAATLKATDKQALSDLATDAGFTIPPTLLVTLDDLPTRVSELRFPAVVKPLRSELDTDDGQLRRFEVVQVDDVRALEAALRTLPGRAGLVQPYLRGHIRTVNGVAWNGDVVVSVHKIAERTWPLDCGMVSYARTVPVQPELDTATRTLLKGLEWSGIFNLQLIESGGTSYVIDLNPRLYHSLALAVRAGANLPAIWTSLLLGKTPTGLGYRSGVHFRAEEDLYALWRMFMAGERGTALRGLLPHTPTVRAVFQVNDPMPSLCTLDRVRRGFRTASGKQTLPTTDS
ncbi:ATP-grasp domain-containing protein [Actinomycetes bacterium KLBMP 9759]